MGPSRKLRTRFLRRTLGLNWAGRGETHHLLCMLVRADPHITTNLAEVPELPSQCTRTRTRSGEDILIHEVWVDDGPVVRLGFDKRRSVARYEFPARKRLIVTCCAPILNPITQSTFLIPRTVVRTAYCARLSPCEKAADSVSGAILTYCLRMTRRGNTGRYTEGARAAIDQRRKSLWDTYRAETWFTVLDGDDDWEFNTC